jgi:hypothetical protein
VVERDISNVDVEGSNPSPRSMTSTGQQSAGIALKGSEKMYYNIQNEETATLLDNAMRHGLAHAVVFNAGNGENVVTAIFCHGDYAQRHAAKMSDHYFTIEYRFKMDGAPASGWYVVSKRHH